MSGYQYYIFLIDSRSHAAGEYVGPFPTEEERDREASRMRSAQKGQRVRLQHGFRVNVAAELAPEIIKAKKSAA